MTTESGSATEFVFEIVFDLAFEFHSKSAFGSLFETDLVSQNGSPSESVSDSESALQFDYWSETG